MADTITFDYSQTTNPAGVTHTVAFFSQAAFTNFSWWVTDEDLAHKAVTITSDTGTTPGGETTFVEVPIGSAFEGDSVAQFLPGSNYLFRLDNAWSDLGHFYWMKQYLAPPPFPDIDAYIADSYTSADSSAHAAFGGDLAEYEEAVFAWVEQVGEIEITRAVTSNTPIIAGALGLDVLQYAGQIDWPDGGYENLVLIGSPYGDVLEGGGGNDSLDGGASIDTALFSGPRLDYLLSTSDNGAHWTVQHLQAGDGIDTLTNIEKAQFSDQTIDLVPAPPLPAPGNADYTRDNIVKWAFGQAWTLHDPRVEPTKFLQYALQLIKGVARAADSSGAPPRDAEYYVIGVLEGRGDDYILFSVLAPVYDLIKAEAIVADYTVFLLLTAAGLPIAEVTLKKILEKVNLSEEDKDISAPGGFPSEWLGWLEGLRTASPKWLDKAMVAKPLGISMSAFADADIQNESAPPVVNIFDRAASTGTEDITINDVVYHIIIGPDVPQTGEDLFVFDRLADLQLVGGSGNDVLVTAVDGQNVDAGDGNDTIVLHGGANAVHAGAGSDYVVAGAGNDTLEGGAGADFLDGGEGINTLDYSSSPSGVVVHLGDGAVSGSDAEGDIIFNFSNIIGSAYADLLAGNDSINAIRGGNGNDTLDGGDGADTAVFNSNYTDYGVTGTAPEFTISGAEGTDVLTSIERLQFADKKLAFDLAQGEAAGNTVRIIGAAFDAPFIIPQFVSIGLNLFDNTEMSVVEVCELAIGTGLFQSLAGSSGNDAFVNLVFQNVVGVAPNDAQRATFVGMLVGSGGSMTQAQLLELAANHPLNAININLTGLQDSGVEFA